MEEFAYFSRPMSSEKRLDQILVDQGLAPSRAKAQELIRSKLVEVNNKPQGWRCVDSCSKKLNSFEVEIRLKDNQLLKYVSRAALKLESLFQKNNFAVNNLRALDIGQSTGGFSDFLLQQGVRQVVGIDVGSNQLHPKLKENDKLICFEKLNVKDLGKSQKFLNLCEEKFDICVIDLSFISLLKVIDSVTQFLVKDALFIGLFKPQFEVGQKNLNKKGVVKSEAVGLKILDEALVEMEKKHFIELNQFASGLKGQDGNQEYFIVGRYSQ